MGESMNLEWISAVDLCFHFSTWFVFSSCQVKGYIKISNNIDPQVKALTSIFHILWSYWTFLLWPRHGRLFYNPVPLHRLYTDQNYRDKVV